MNHFVVTGSWISRRYGVQAVSVAALCCLVFALCFESAWPARASTATDAWRNTGMMNVANSGHAAMLLPNGKVLAIGGNSIETYDPGSEIWNLLGSGGGRSATLLRDGRVLLAGIGAAIYDPVSNTRQSVTSVFDPDRFTSIGGHSATLLPNGKVLLAGGLIADYVPPTNAVYLYDPANNVWSRAAAMKFAHYGHSASLLPNGKLLVAGGYVPAPRQSRPEAELYDPATDTWTQTGSLRAPRSGHTATLLADGRVLVAGGSAAMLTFTEIYDPATGSWTATGNLNEARQNTNAVLLRDGRVLLTGGSIYVGGNYRYLSSVEIFTPATSGWTLTDPLITARAGHSLTLLPDGRVLAAGGENNGGSLRSAEIFDPSKATQLPPTSPPKITAVAASSFRGGSLATESIVSIFGEGLANFTQVADTNPLPVSMGGVRVWVGDATFRMSASLFFVSPNQINIQIPSNIQPGPALIEMFPSGSIQWVMVNRVEPGLFSAEGTGKGLAAAVVLRAKANGEQVYEPVARFDAAQNRVVAVPIDVSNENEQVFLILYGTGIRNRSTLSAVAATVGGTSSEVLFAGLQGDFVGLDQINLRLPSSLAGRGEVDVLVTADGAAANAVKIGIK